MEENIKIIVNNIVEDESGVGGLWDLAREMAIQALGYPDGDKDLHNAIEETQERFYNTLLDYASYTDPERYSNSMKEGVNDDTDETYIKEFCEKVIENNENAIRMKFLERLDTEYTSFKNSKLSLSKEEIYGDACEIRFYEEVYEYFQNIEIDIGDYEILDNYATSSNILNSLWHSFPNWQGDSIGAYGDIYNFISDYLGYYRRFQQAGCCQGE